MHIVLEATTSNEIGVQTQTLQIIFREKNGDVGAAYLWRNLVWNSFISYATYMKVGQMAKAIEVPATNKADAGAKFAPKAGKAKAKAKAAKSKMKC